MQIKGCTCLSRSYSLAWKLTSQEGSLGLIEPVNEPEGVGENMIRSLLSLFRLALLSLLLLQAPGCSSPEDRAQGHYERGMKLLAQNDHVKAGIEFKNALQLKK